MHDVDELISQVESVVGLEAYHLYPNSRRMIPPEVLWGIASACAIEFIKGFVDLKSVGKTAKELLLELCRQFRKRDSFEAFIQENDFAEALVAAFLALPTRIVDQDYEKGRAALEGALVEFGLPPASASSRASEIAKLVRSASGLARDQ